MIILALIGGIVLVQRQKKLSLLAANVSETPTLAYTPVTGGLPPPDMPYQNAGQQTQAPFVAPIAPPHVSATGGRPPGPGTGPIPFDPDLAEALRQAQVSLFIMPRPGVGEEILS